MIICYFKWFDTHMLHCCIIALYPYYLCLPVMKVMYYHLTMKAVHTHLLYLVLDWLKTAGLKVAAPAVAMIVVAPTVAAPVVAALLNSRSTDSSTDTSSTNGREMAVYMICSTS